MKISYLITTHNELEFLNVFCQVFEYCNPSRKNRGDEVVILDDFSTDERMQKSLASICADTTNCRVIQHALSGDFGAHKNHGSRQCTGDYIVQLDADEHLSQPLLDNLPELLESNPQVELYRVPRVNIVRGATQEDAYKWGWHMSKLTEYGDLPIINWNSGDYQSRIYKNTEKIKWHKPLHETIVGAEYVSDLPKEVDYAIVHDKTIDRQRAQNEFYNKNWSTSANMGNG